MKILIATTVNPFVEGGSTYIVDWLDHVLKQRGHEVETFRFPFSDRPADVLDQLVGLRLIDLSQSGSSHHDPNTEPSSEAPQQGCVVHSPLQKRLRLVGYEISGASHYTGGRRMQASHHLSGQCRIARVLQTVL